MLITEETFEAFLKCETKSHLYFQRAVGVQSEFSEWQRNLLQKFKETGWERLRSTVREDQWCVGTPALQSLEDRRYRFIIDYTVALPEIHSRIHALELIRSASKTRDHLYIPLRFVPSEKLSIYDRLLLAFDAFALSQTCGKTPHVGRIIHGCQYATVTVPLAGLLDKVRLVLGNMAAQQASTTAPPLVLNKHCAECEFRSRCRQTAIEKDDLSLLPNIGEKERKKQNDKGIFTVLQLSYTFRPRRRAAHGLLKHQPAVKALALRKNQIHILGTPAVSQSGTPVYIDVEGDPDRDFYYLVGLRIGSGDSAVRYSFWANDLADERTVWEGCLRVLSMIGNPRLIHYGSYETQFLKRMRTRYPDIENPSFLGHLISSALNLLSVIYAHVYFPTYSNGLKEVASYLGFRWSDGAASGLTALVWRSQWESSHDPSLKEKLLAYNAEDCEAAEKVTEAICAVCRPLSSEEAPKLTAVNVDSLKREYPQRFGEVEFVLPEFQQINEAAYWDYQRNKVYIRLNRRLKRLSRKTAMEHPLAEVPVNKVITVEEQRPVSCRCCNSTLIYKFGKMSQIVYDLMFSTAGVKRWVTRYSFSRYICWHCKATLQLYVHKHKYGIGLRSYLLYQIIELQIPQNAISKVVRQLFSLPLSRGAVNWVKATEIGLGHKAKWEYFRTVYERYHRAGREAKHLMLNEFCLNTGYHRKYAIRLLKGAPPGKQPERRRRGRRARYGPQVLSILAAIWEAAGYPWSVRLKALLPSWLPWIRKRYRMTSAMEKQLLDISARQIDRRLKAKKGERKRRIYGRTKPGSLLKHHIPVKTDSWDVTGPGFSEIDLVAHCGNSGDGEFAHTLNLTDIHSGWTESRALLGKSQVAVQQGLDEIEKVLPFRLLGVDSDNGSEFINWHRKGWCEQKQIQLTRGRPYKKDDNAHVEQKNWTHVRKLLGWERYDSEAVVEAINDLYRHELRWWMNLYLPSVKLVKKVRVGSKVRRVYDAAQTPFERVLAGAQMKPEPVAELKKLRQGLDPFQLGKLIDQKLQRIYDLANRRLSPKVTAENRSAQVKEKEKTQHGRRNGCGKAAPWKSPKPDFSTELANRAKSARFALSHSCDDGGSSVTFSMSRRSNQGYIFKWLDAEAPRCKMSAAGRRRIAVAQRARWKKIRARKNRANTSNRLRVPGCNAGSRWLGSERANAL